MYLAHVVCGLKPHLEDKRDDAELDGRLDHLERAVSSLIDALTWHRGAPMTRGKTRNWLPRPDTDNDVFRQQHQLRTTGEREVNGTRRSVLLNDGESPLGWLKDRNGNPFISGPQYEGW